MCEQSASVRFKDSKGPIERLPNKTWDRLCLLSVILLAGIWALYTFDKLAVTSEGWYNVYSDMILAGKVPYRDFELVFPPLFTYIMAFVTAICGDGILASRVIGVFMFIALAALAYYIFRLLFPSWIAAVAALVSIFVLQSEITFMAYDYSRFYDFFNNLAFFILLRLIVKSYRKEEVNVNLNMFLAGVVCALSILMRQSSGAIVFAYFAVFLILIFFVIKTVNFRRRDLLSFFVGLSIPIAITAVLLMLAGAFTPFIEMTLFSGSKGSLSSMLFNWIPRVLRSAVENFFSIAVTAIMAASLVFLWKWRSTETEDTVSDRIFYIIFAAIATVSITVLLFSLNISSMVAPLSRSLLTPMFIINFVLGLALLFRVVSKIRNKEEVPLLDVAYLFFCGFIFAVGFGCGTSGGLSLGEAALNFGFVIAILLNCINKIPKIELRNGLKTTAMAFVIFLLATSVSTTVVTPYSWWGMTTEHYSDATYETDIGYFKGIKITANEKFVYEDFVSKADLYLGDNDNLYCYSQIPMFYTLAGKLPTVKAPICWFDVSRDSTMLEDLEYLKQNNPKLIMFADHGEYVLRAHEEGFRDGGESGHRRMYEWLLECRDGPGSNYVVVGTYFLHNYDMYLMLRI